ncbi:MAG: aminoglycoside phosphotransferase family protein [Oscillospiraceae bacterium]|nr:aminoglycoside phosphotransferase family protein [Oscillospiraceae bacterium]
MENIETKNEILKGGTQNQVEKIGDTVHRTIKGHPMLHKYLLYLEKEGMPGVPRFLGIDEQEREILSYLSGKTIGRDYDFDHPCLSSDETIKDTGRFIRKLHDKSVGFVRTAIEGGWKNPHFPDDEHEIICHNDNGIWNFIFIEDKIAGMFDFDDCYPGSRIWDLTTPLLFWLPSADGYDPENTEQAEEAKRRINLFFDGYGMNRPADIMDIVVQRIMTYFDSEEEANANGWYQNMARHFKAHGHLWV